MPQENLRINGTIVRGIGGFYYVEASGTVYECKAKGLFRKENITPMVGDQVEIVLGEQEENVITTILPRRNHFVRPPVANVEITMVVTAAADPRPNFSVIDKLIVMAEKNDTEVLLVFNKLDKADENFIEHTNKVYLNTGYPIFFSSVKTGVGLSEIRDAIRGKKSMVAGPSGVGKSSLINAMEGFQMKTGAISEKTLRGKHTTRHVELLSGKDGICIFDTPGFTSFEILEMEAEELKDYFPEFESFALDCKFNSCVHGAEPGCMVKQAVEDGQISQQRYTSYLRLYKELSEKKKIY